MISTSSILDRPALVAWYHRNRARSRALFDMLADEAYYSQPIALRHPIVFYEGHLPAFSFNTLVKKGLGLPGIDERLEALFARGIDPHDGGSDRAGGAGRAGGASGAGRSGGARRAGRAEGVARRVPARR